MSAVPDQQRVSNAQFLQGIFHEYANEVHVCGFADPPDAIGDRKVWAGRRFKGRDLNPDHNNYFVISTFSMLNEDGRQRAVRRKAQFLAGHCVVVDDVGTKVKDTERLPPPSWRLETSPNNEQWGYILDKPCTDGALFSGTLALMVAKGLSVDGTDPGMKGVTRYVRLPVGVNRKSKYAPMGFVCNLHEWQPERTYSLARLLSEFDATEDEARAYAEGVGTAARVAAPADDVRLRALEQAGKYRGPIAGKPGWHEIECPWLEDHSDGDDSGTGVFVGQGGYGFKCHHGHCTDKTFNDVAGWLQARNVTGFDAVKAQGTLVKRASDFMQRLEAPRWIFDKVIQRGYLYSLTARWGHAKTAVMLYAAFCAATGRDFAGHRVERTRVLYLAGENPSDIRVRVALLLRDFDMDAGDLDDWLFFTERSFTVTADAQVKAVLDDAHLQAKDFGMVIVDTGAAHSDMDEENSNTEQLQFAKAVRRFLEALDGRPAVVCMMHPTKDAGGLYELQPRGGGAFAAEIDGELVLWKEENAPRATMHHQPKFRGPGFEPINFVLEAIEMPDLLDNFGKPTVSVLAKPTDAPSPSAIGVAPGGARQRAAWDALNDILSNAADHIDAIHEDVRGAWGVPVQYLRVHTLARVGKRLADDEKGNYKKTIEGMIDKGDFFMGDNIKGVQYVAMAFPPQTLKP